MYLFKSVRERAALGKNLYEFLLLISLVSSCFQTFKYLLNYETNFQQKKVSQAVFLSFSLLKAPNYARLITF